MKMIPLTRHAFFQLGLSMIALVAGMDSLQAQKVVDEDTQGWIQYYNQTNLGRNWIGYVDGGFRWSDGIGKLASYIVRGAAGYSLGSNTSVAVGFANLGVYADSKIIRQEYRPFQELQFRHTLGKVGITHRYRVEERFFHNLLETPFTSSPTFSFRFRYAVIASIPIANLSAQHLDRKLLLNVGNEIFINAGSEVTHDVFNQNRFTLSPSIQFSKSLTVSFTWNNQFASTSIAGVYRHSQVMWLQVRHSLDLSRKSSE